MSRLVQAPKIEVFATIKLNEQELRALDALVGYGDQPFLDAFYKLLGKAYMEPHEAGIRSLFEVIRADLVPILARASAARKAFCIQNSPQGDKP